MPRSASGEHTPKQRQMSVVLSLEQISKSFPGVRALDGVDFDVRAGEVHALLGENGAGKSTLIKIISGVYQPDAGTIRLDGEAVALRDARATPSAAGIATIYQELLLFPELTVAENIFLGHAPRDPLRRASTGRAMRARGARAARLARHPRPRRRRAWSARSRSATASGSRSPRRSRQDARILIMDEPTAALTEADVERLFGIVRLLRERGVGIVYISHRLEEVFELADRVTVLRDGALCRAPSEVAETEHDELVKMMVGRTIENAVPEARGRRSARPVLEVARPRRSAPRFRDVEPRAARGRDPRHRGLVGSGRTELAQTIFGITPADSRRRSLIDGKPVRIDEPRPGQAPRHRLCAGGPRHARA